MSLYKSLLVFISTTAFFTFLSGGIKMFTTTLSGIEFKTSHEFSEPLKAGLDTYLLTYPKSVKPEDEKMSLTLAFLSAKAQKEMGMTDSELLQYAKTTFLATSKPGNPQKLDFFGKSVSGEILQKKIPAPSTLEVFLLPLKNGDKMVIGFSYAGSFAAEAKKIILEISGSLKETK